MVNRNFRHIIKELFGKLRTSLKLKIRGIENVTEILSFDQEVMGSIHIWPIDQVDIKILLLAILTQLIPNVSKIMSEVMVADFH